MDSVRELARIAGGLLLVPAVAAGVVAIVSVIVFQDFLSAGVFSLLSAIPLLIAWMSSSVSAAPQSDSLAVKSGGVAAAWMMASVVCAIPFLAVAHLSTEQSSTLETLRSPLDAVYESTSSLSSSGLTVCPKSSELPPSLQLWRSLLQWIGGVGLAVFALLILESAELGKSLYRAETRSWQPTHGVQSTVKLLLMIYGSLTVACGIAFCACQMPLWEAINHCLIICSTGGLTVTDDSFRSYNAPIKCVAVLFMVLAAVPFSMFVILPRDGLKKLLRRDALIAFVGWGALLSVCLMLDYFLFGTVADGTWFNLISAISTCGVNDGDLEGYPTATSCVFIIAMFVGACGDSTAGGFKVNRLWWSLKISAHEFAQNLGLAGKDTFPRWNGSEAEADEAQQRTRRTLVVFTIFSAAHTIGFIALRMIYSAQVGSDRILFQTTSALSAVGLSMGLSGADRPAAAKLVEIALMLAGRLEVLALILLAAVAVRACLPSKEEPTG